MIAVHPSRDVKFINTDVRRTKKLLVGVGCSFTQGTSSYDLELIADKPPIEVDYIYGYQGYDLATKQYIAKTYKDITLTGTDLNTHNHQFNNSYINILAQKYLKSEWTPINFGLEGSGNTGSINRLMMYPIDWNHADEIVVIYMPTGLARFDIVNDAYHNLWEIGCDHATMWPHSEEVINSLNSNKAMAKNQGAGNNAWNLMQLGYFKSIWSKKFEVKKAILEFQILKNWCSMHNAKLLVFPAFNPEYTRQLFAHNLKNHIERNLQTRDTIIDEETKFFDADLIEHLVSSVPWDRFVKIKKCSTFSELALLHEPTIENKHEYYRPEPKVPTPNLWLMGCGHPGKKAHDLLARELVPHIRAL